VEPNNGDNSIRLKLVRLLRQESQLNCILQISVANASNSVRQTKPLIGIQSAIAHVVEIFHRELVPKDCRLQFQARYYQTCLRDIHPLGSLGCRRRRLVCASLIVTMLELAFSLLDRALRDLLDHSGSALGGSDWVTGNKTCAKLYQTTDHRSESRPRIRLVLLKLKTKVFVRSVLRVLR